MTSFTIGIAPNPADTTGGTVTPVTAHFQEGWRHSIRAVGGNWHGEGVYGGTRAEKEDFFLSSLGLRLLVSSGGIDWYEGQIIRMEYTRAGQTFVRSMEEMANRVKVLYTKIGPQILTDGDVESGSWAAVGTPSTIEVVTTWFARGASAMHCISDAADEGMMIESGASIITQRAYICGVVVNACTGTWTLQVLDHDTSDEVAQCVTGGYGQEWMQCNISDTNETASSVDVRLICSGAAAEIYADGAFLRLAPVRSETRWYEDANSIDEYGRIEGVFLEGEMVDDEAAALAQKALSERAWARTYPPARGGMMTAEQAKTPDKLMVTTQGLVWTLTWRHALTNGTAAASAHAVSLLDESEFIAASDAFIDANSTEVLIESNDPITLWRGLEKVIQAGDGSGSPWMGGAYPGYEFRYNERPTALQYEVRDGLLHYYRGGLVQSMEIEPGWCLMRDMPLEPTPADAGTIDDPRRAWLDEVWFVSEKGNVRIEWTVEQGR